MKNMSGTDRIIRVLIAAVVAILFFTRVVSGVPGIVLMVVGGVFLLTAIAGVCPLYMLFGWSTGKKK